ncbi:hypothetical protein FHS85_000385 [Rhodoligotrophos appendicifer]|uniref:hypothetical protein n=1 Tax=Rhodoligotrophos appendicifer TaxID=987056 RepID=UPI0011804098|nr:hypothetical protein [Rhodoligotrophos appendicifer]
MQHKFLASLLFSVIGLGLALAAYAAPLGNTGVDGSLGALLALIGAGVTAAGTGLLVLGVMPNRGVLVFVFVLLLAAGLTAVAAWFLMQFVFAAAMGAAFLSFIFAFFSSVRRTAS